ncbi:MAG: xanthine dehydrogenase family protein molybdopterin-binding subunit [Bradymonadales bacterium]|jgi:CO/xanthine dehydrogenase Mo-binding subunit
MQFKVIGSNVTRPDAVKKITGKALFLDDLSLPGMLYAAILRPDVAHAKILEIDCTEAAAMPGVVKVVTGEGCDFRYGDNIRDLTPMAVDKVRYAGEPLAAVIAVSKRAAQDALKLIKVKLEPLPIYTDARDAIKEGACVIHELNGQFEALPKFGGKPNTNIANEYRLRKGDIAAGFAKAAHIIEGEFDYPISSSAAIEPHGAIAWFHEDGSIECWSSSICPFIIRDELARAYKLPLSSVRVHIPELGGCFGYKSDITVEQTVAWIASFVPGRPVKWVASRKEDFTSTLVGNGLRIKMRLGATAQGKFTALETRILHTTGAYADTGVHVCIAATHNSTGAYEFENCDFEGISVYTNTTPVGAYRGYGHQCSQFAVELLIHRLARQMGLDPFELREMNYLGPGKVTALGENLYETNGDIRACVKIVRDEIWGKAKPDNDEEYVYGRGFSAVMKSPKGAPFSTKGVYLKFNLDGSVCINAGGAEVGQGLRNVARQIAAERLKISPDRISVYTEIDTQFSPYEWQTIGSMFTVQGGRAIMRACDKAIAMLKRTASQVLRLDEDLLVYDGDFVYLSTDPSFRVSVPEIARGYIYPDGVTVGDMVQTTADMRLPRYSNFDHNGQGALGVSYTFGAQACELKIHRKTGQIVIEHFASSFDIGRVINPIQLRGQIAGGVVMGIGATLTEVLRFDELGVMTNPHFSKYRFPNINDAPKKQSIIFVENPEDIGPYGARGIGEHPVIGVAPAICDAIYDALGLDIDELPVSKDLLLQALEKTA